MEDIDELSVVNEYLGDGEKDILIDEVLKSEPKRQSAGERRRLSIPNANITIHVFAKIHHRSEIMGQHRFQGADGTHCYFNLKVIFEPYKTGFEESKDLKHPKGTILGKSEKC